MLKCVFISTLLFTVGAFGHDALSIFSDNDLDFLANLDINSLPKPLQLLLSKSTRVQESGFCCKSAADMVVPVKAETHEKFRTEKVARTLSSTHQCGHYHRVICYSYRLVYEIRTVSYLDTTYVPDPSLCPAQDLACCLNHIMVSGSCIDVTDSSVIHSIQDIIALQNAGLIGTSPSN